MSLSDDERDRLHEIEALLAAADHRFARRLDLAAVGRRRQHLRWACWAMFPLGAALLSIGAGTAQGFLSVGAVLAGVGWALMVWSTFTAHSLRTRRP